MSDHFKRITKHSLGSQLEVARNAMPYNDPQTISQHFIQLLTFELRQALVSASNKRQADTKSDMTKTVSLYTTERFAQELLALSSTKLAQNRSSVSSVSNVVEHEWSFTFDLADFATFLQNSYWCSAMYSDSDWFVWYDDTTPVAAQLKFIRQKSNFAKHRNVSDAICFPRLTLHLRARSRGFMQVTSQVTQQFSQLKNLPPAAPNLVPN